MRRGKDDPLLSQLQAAVPGKGVQCWLREHRAVVRDFLRASPPRWQAIATAMRKDGIDVSRQAVCKAWRKIEREKEASGVSPAPRENFPAQPPPVHPASDQQSGDFVFKPLKPYNKDG